MGRGDKFQFVVWNKPLPLHHFIKKTLLQEWLKFSLYQSDVSDNESFLSCPVMLHLKYVVKSLMFHPFLLPQRQLKLSIQLASHNSNQPLTCLPVWILKLICGGYCLMYMSLVYTEFGQVR